MMALCLDGSALAMDVAVDRPGDWWNPQASHHAEHAMGGALIGVAGYMGASLVTDDSDKRIAMGTACGLAIGAAFELERGRDGGCYVDPVDVAWTTAGALVGAVVADLTNDLATVAFGPRGASITVAWRF
jgi:hypothetical protein